MAGAAYYNEIDPYAADWLRNLIAAGHIAPGDVDERSIEDVHPDDLRGYTQCHFFAGIGVWSYALRRAGWPDDRPVWTGSCPCQPFSAAGKGAAFDDERHLWPDWHWLIQECHPPVVFGEQVESRDGLGWLDLVQADLEGLEYACGRSLPLLRATALARTRAALLRGPPQRSTTAEAGATKLPADPIRTASTTTGRRFAMRQSSRHGQRRKRAMAAAAGQPRPKAAGTFIWTCRRGRRVLVERRMDLLRRSRRGLAAS